MTKANEPAASRPPLLVEISAGELVDKIAILRIKRERIADAGKRANVLRELTLLQAVRDRALEDSDELTALAGELQAINERLWDVEDALRDRERQSAFGEAFVALARSVYHLNDRRALLKRRINAHCGSTLVEEKSYLEPPPSVP